MDRDHADYVLCGAIVAAVLAAFTITLTLSHTARTKITNDATYAQVVKNFGGKPYDTGQFVSGYTCAGYTNGDKGHGWVVIRCEK